ncbi:MAG: hypothetical protein E6I99_13965 [Chloroflexi bacterium]|nr:MAG: hypothetical protein E6I99_13965 [Chloroflexota bacterium]
MLREIPVRRDCPQCGHVDFSAAVSVIVVWAHGLTTAIPMIPEDELRICASGRCRAAYRLVSRAFDVHPKTQATVGPWTRAVIVLEDGNGVEIHNSSGQILACA